jgi:hypothetical protein
MGFVINTHLILLLVSGTWWNFRELTGSLHNVMDLISCSSKLPLKMQQIMWQGGSSEDTADYVAGRQLWEYYVA